VNNVDRLMRYTRDDLRAMCRNRGLSTSGTKAQLAARLVAPAPVSIKDLAGIWAPFRERSDTPIYWAAVRATAYVPRSAS
jgi:hypothetical protein